jgi:tRNA dimethylallyltransferase
MSLVVFLVGPTAVGKTELALRLAPKINAEIISCDSMQVYIGMDIGTSKPAPGQREAVKHHLIDIVSVDEGYSAANYREQAIRTIEKLIREGKTPLVVGGSGLYFKAVVDGIFEGPDKNSRRRQELYTEARTKGNLYLYNKLKEIDSVTAAKLHPNDIRRIVRALEVYYSSGRPISWFKKNTVGLAKEYEVIIYGLNRARNELYERIDRRVEEMFDSGLIEEVRKLREKGMTLVAQQSLGYKEVVDYLAGKFNLDETKEILKRNTRRFAKRQLSWFHADKRIHWINLDENTDLDDLSNRLANQIKIKNKI